MPKHILRAILMPMGRFQLPQLRQITQLMMMMQKRLQQEMHKPLPQMALMPQQEETLAQKQLPAPQMTLAQQLLRLQQKQKRLRLRQQQLRQPRLLMQMVVTQITR